MSFIMSKSTIVMLCWDWSSWIEPELKKRLMCLAQGNNAVTPERLKPATHRSRIMHSTI